MTEERVKPCLRCDGIIPFADSHCPSCGAFGDPAPARPLALETPPPSPVGSPLLTEALLVGSGAALAAGTLLAVA